MVDAFGENGGAGRPGKPRTRPLTSAAPPSTPPQDAGTPIMDEPPLAPTAPIVDETPVPKTLTVPESPGLTAAIEVGVAAEVLRRVGRTRQVVSLVSQVIIRAYEEEALHNEVCRHLVTFGGYLMAWVGLAEETPKKIVRPVAHAGLESNFLEALRITWSNDLLDQSPTSRAIREQRPYVARNIPTDPRMAGLRRDAKLHGYTATCAVPIQFAGHGMGVITIHSAEPDAFGPEEVSLLRELATDLSSGVIALREKVIRMSLEEETRRAEGRLRSIVENAQEGIFECTRDGRLLKVNAALVELLGYQAPGELLRAGPPELATHVHPDDRKLLGPALSDRAPPIQVRLRAKAGGWIWAAIHVKDAEGDMNLGDAQGPDGPLYVGFVRDLTQHRSQQEAIARLASVVDAADEGIIATDVEGVVTDWNGGATRLFGYSRAEVLGRPLAEFLIPPERHDEHVRVLGSIARGERVPRFETVRLCKELNLIHTSVSMNPIFTGQKELMGCTIVEHDITEARLSAAAKDAKRLKETEVLKLKGLEKLRQTFMSEASHELNTPLTPLRIHVEALAESLDLSDAQRGHVVVIERNVLRLCNLVRDMLVASRLETGRFKLETVDLPIVGVLDDVVQGLTETAKRGGVSLTLAPTGRLVVRADRNRLGQVLFNLVTNAISFTPPGGRVDVDARVDGDFVTVRVTDTGLGLSADQVPQLFQPFARPHEGQGTAVKGTGLGLFISKGIVDEHGGRIWAESPGPGLGSTFCFTMPRGKGRAQVAAQPSEGPRAPARPTAPAPSPPISATPTRVAGGRAALLRKADA